MIPAGKRAEFRHVLEPAAGFLPCLIQSTNRTVLLPQELHIGLMKHFAIIAETKQNILFVQITDHCHGGIVTKRKPGVWIDRCQQFFHTRRIVVPEFFIDKQLDFRIHGIFRPRGCGSSVTITVKGGLKIKIQINTLLFQFRDQIKDTVKAYFIETDVFRSLRQFVPGILSFFYPHTPAIVKIGIKEMETDHVEALPGNSFCILRQLRFCHHLRKPLNGKETDLLFRFLFKSKFPMTVDDEASETAGRRSANRRKSRAESGLI